tara:strand:+ start:8132 stop:9784 length:1653 start_codon:yes stop_codon:yes gene_type:complete
LKNVRGDILGGLTAAVVALPLALAFGETALGDGGAIYGLYGAVIVGFLAALFGGTPSQVSGPTGPMSVTVAVLVIAILQKESLSSLPAEQIVPLIMGAVIVGGIFQILFGLLKLGKYITLVPYSVVSGFMSGIGFIIIATQLGPLLGIQTDKGVLNGLISLSQNFAPFLPAVVVSALTMIIVFFAPRKITQWVPSPLLALLIITPLSVLIFNDSNLIEKGKDVLPRIGNIPEGGLQFSMPDFKYKTLILTGGLQLAVLGAIDSLLTSLVADNITQTRHDSNRELIGQGIGNAVGGFFGGLPGAGATMRTVINVKSGGMTPLSGMTHSIVLLIVLVAAGPLASQIPKALLAGILIKVGLDIIDWRFLLRAHKLSIKTAAVMYGVLLMTVFWNLIWAVLVGVFVANMLTIDSITQTQLEGMDEDNPIDNKSLNNAQLPSDEKDLLDKCGGEVMLFRLKGPLSFGAAKGISERMMLIKKYKFLILDITDVPRMGVTASLAIEDMMLEAKNNNRKAIVAGANEKVKERLAKFGVEGIVSSRKEALIAAVDELSK